MSEKFNVLQSAMASSERIFTLLDTPVTVMNAAQPVKVAGALTGHIVFDHVWFAYNGEDWVLKDVSFEVRPGQRVGLVGATGSGKTTIISLLLRFYEVQRGRILVDGHDIKALDLAQLRALFALVLQDVHLFSGTVTENIRLGEARIDESQVRRAAEAVRAHRFIADLKDGYGAHVAERGATFSTGEKQLLSFARALAFDRRVLILDEATSSVDTETELVIRDALDVLMRGRTTIAVAHRLSTIQGMDTILVLHKGVLREQGTHQELLAKRGIYYRLYQLQFKDAGRRARRLRTTDYRLRTSDYGRLQTRSQSGSPAVCSPKSDYLNSGPIATKNRQSLLPKLAPAKIGPISDSATAPALMLLCQSLSFHSSQADPVSSHDPTNTLPPRTSGNRPIRFR